MPAPQQLIVLLFMAVPDLLVIFYKPLNTTINYQLPITNYQLPITNYQLPITQKICPGADVGESLSLYFMKKCNLH
ncbi:MAG: hypothetical protein ACK51W_00985 [Aphanizomenon sp.]